MLVATAGHIDHGKTSLIRALTGIETDRLPEERVRGISIDLGFAYWGPKGVKTIGFIDVPGHERFVRNMLAGVSTADYALLVVAADDGVMPQTTEHVQILDLLGIERGVVAITKCDRVSQQRIASVRAEIQQLLTPTTLADAAIFEVSCITGAGIAELGDALCAVSRTEVCRPTRGHHFRLSIDRAFSVTGIGTVVTGTVLDGILENGARLTLSPLGLDVRVRGLQSAGRPVSRVQAGDRCAVNLAGLELAQVHRGDWLLTPAMHAPTSRIEARLMTSRSNGEPLRHNTAVHLHLGTMTIRARVLSPRQSVIPADSEATVQLALEKPACALSGDRFILRDQSGRRLIGGGRVIDPFVSSDRRMAGNRAEVSTALQSTDAVQALAKLLHIPGYEVDTVRFERSFNLEAGAARELYRDSNAVLFDTQPRLAVPSARVVELRARILDVLQGFHHEQPEAIGMGPRDLRSRLGVPLSREAFLALQKSLIEEHIIESVGTVLKLRSHVVRFNAIDQARWQQLLPRLQRRGVQPFTVRELAGELNTSEPIVKALLYRKRSSGEVWRITEQRFMLRSQLAALAARAAVLTQEVGGRGFTAAQYRDAIGTGRTLAIQILEFFDSVGVTYRNGDFRKIRADYELVMGNAPPYVALI